MTAAPSASAQQDETVNGQPFTGASGDEQARQDSDAQNANTRARRHFQDSHAEQNFEELEKYWDYVGDGEAAEDFLGHCTKIKKTQNGLAFSMDNGHDILWQIMDGQEFIGMQSSRFFKMDEKDAHSIIEAAAMHGWKEINIHGNESEKALLWLEAQKLGLEVKGYKPTQEVAAQWQAMTGNYQQSSAQTADASAPGSKFTGGSTPASDTQEADWEFEPDTTPGIRTALRLTPGPK